MNKHTAEIKVKELDLATKKHCLAAFCSYGMLKRLLELLFLRPASLSASQNTKIKLEIRKKTRIYNLKRIGAI